MTGVDSGADLVRVVTAGGVVRAHAVVLALPPALGVATIEFTPLPPEDLAHQAASTPVWMGRVVKGVATFERAFWRDEGLAGTALSHRGPFVEFHDLSSARGAPAAVLAFAGAEAFTSGDEAEAAFRRQLVELFGVAAGAPRAVHVADWSREPATIPQTGIEHGPTRLPSDPTVHGYGHPLFQTAIGDPRLHWASTETATAFPGPSRERSTPGSAPPSGSSIEAVRRRRVIGDHDRAPSARTDHLVIAVVDLDAVPDHAPRRCSDGAFVRDVLVVGEGPAMLALGSTDAVASDLVAEVVTVPRSR